MLPKIDVPIYSLNLISSGEKIRFRPFTVKEEKLFLMAMESNEVDTTINTIKQVVNNCLLDEININSLPIFDLEYLFLNLRARSIGEEVTLKYRCNNDVDKEDGTKDKCGNMVEFTFNILDVKPKVNEKHDKKIVINDKLGIMMKYPSFDLIENSKETENVEDLIMTITSCIDYIYDENQIYYAKDSSKEELIEFVESLQTKDLENIKYFFDTSPKLEKVLNFQCNKCGHKDEITLEGIQNFFG